MVEVTSNKENLAIGESEAPKGKLWKGDIIGAIVGIPAPIIGPVIGGLVGGAYMWNKYKKKRAA